MSPDDLDLVSFVRDDQLVLMAVTREWNSDPVPNKGAIGPLAEKAFAKFPDLFASKRDCESWLMLVHFRNMGFGANSAGQPYPAPFTPKPAPPTPKTTTEFEF